MNQFTARVYNKFELDELRSIITKYSSTDRLLDEIEYYRGIEGCLESFFPRVFSDRVVEDKENEHSISMEYYGYPNLESYNGCWKKVSSKIVNILRLFRECEQLQPLATVQDNGELRKKMFVDKTTHYHGETLNRVPLIRSLDSNQYVEINGKSFLTFTHIWGDVEKLINQTLINDSPFTVIHGDMCFSNILYDERGDIIKFIDPRGSFGVRGLWGDQLYDLAKLSHSFSGLYEYMIYDKFSVQWDESSINYHFDDDDHTHVKEAFMKHLEFQDRRIKLIEGLIFIGMCSRHYDSLHRQVLMYATGIKLLNEVVNENLC